MPFEVVRDATLSQVTLVTGKGALGTWRSYVWPTTKVGRAMILRTSWEVNRNEWGVCERALKLHASREGFLGKAKAKTGIGKSDLPGL
jgi:hypothetical protein